MLIIGASSLLLSNVSKEKENRIMEVLLTSVTPSQLLTGKILGLGLVGLGQTLIWFGTSYILLNLSGRIFVKTLPVTSLSPIPSLSSGVHLPISFLAWGLVFFVLGYAVYASLLAGLGALAPNLREASQVTFVIMLPIALPWKRAETMAMVPPPMISAMMAKNASAIVYGSASPITVRTSR